MKIKSRLTKTLIMTSAVVALAGLAQTGVHAKEAPAADPLAPRYASTLAEGIDFRKPGYPNFLVEVTGVSGHEPWGRWTDATLSPTATFKFSKPLPKNFTLELQASAFGPNVNTPSTIRAGKIEHQIVPKDGSQQDYKLEFKGVTASTLEIIPAKPTAPKDIKDLKNPDPRKLGIGLITLKIK